jgi:hypothetical protein
MVILFKELSKDSVELEEIKVLNHGIGLKQKKSSNFYSIPMKNVVSCQDLKENISGRLLTITLF